MLNKTDQHIIDTPKKFLKDKLNIDVNENPEIQINNSIISNTIDKYKINKNDINILLGIGGSGPTKRVPSKIFLTFIDKITKVKKCKFFLATGKKDEEQKIKEEILNSKFSKQCTALDSLSLNEILPIIKNCNVAICNDSSFSHLSAALDIPTIVLMADTPILYGNYSPMMFPIIPDGEETVTHDIYGRHGRVL